MTPGWRIFRICLSTRNWNAVGCANPPCVNATMRSNRSQLPPLQGNHDQLPPRCAVFKRGARCTCFPMHAAGLATVCGPSDPYATKAGLGPASWGNDVGAVQRSISGADSGRKLIARGSCSPHMPRTGASLGWGPPVKTPTSAPSERGGAARRSSALSGPTSCKASTENNTNLAETNLDEIGPKQIELDRHQPKNGRSQPSKSTSSGRELSEFVRTQLVIGQIESKATQLESVLPPYALYKPSH